MSEPTSTSITTSRRNVAWALAYGAICHLTFLLAVGSMVLGLHQGMGTGLGRLSGWSATAANALLVLQFPFVHSLLLSSYGRRVLAALAPRSLAGPLAPTTYVALASLQVLVTFALWTPSGVVWWTPAGPLRWGFEAAYAVSWVLVLKTMSDAGLGVQTGYGGWLAVARGEAPAYGSFPTGGSFRYCRQPIYAAFALTLWTGPVWTPDRLAVAVVWTVYCAVGPLLKERRYVARYGAAFREYQRAVPYMVPARRRASAPLEAPSAAGGAR